jgi:two-component system LytT family response regulator
MNIKAIIVDDELHSLQTTELLVQKYCPKIEITGLAESAEKGIQLIDKLKPDIVFLDIAMPVMNGFEMLQHITYKSFEIVFTTAYDEYAIKAFKVNAIDYLLKPIDPEELVQAMEKVKEKLDKHEQYNKIDELLKMIGQPEVKRKKVALSIDGKIKMIPFDSIIYCESESNYTYIYLAQGKRVMISKTLKEVEKIIGNPGFFRVQNSYLVNLGHIKEYIRGEGGELIMSNGDEVKVSRKKKEELMKLLI